MKYYFYKIHFIYRYYVHYILNSLVLLYTLNFNLINLNLLCVLITTFLKKKSMNLKFDVYRIR